MLSPADSALVARDTALPGLAGTLDAVALAREIGLGAFEASYLRYKPGRSCVAGIVPSDGGLGALAVMTYPPERYAEVRARAEWQAGSAPVRFLDDVCTALVPLRHERKLKGARAVGRAGRRARFLATLGLDGAVLGVLRYKPGRRLVLRAETRSGGAVLVKLHTARSFSSAAAGARHADRLAGVPLLAESDRRGTLVSRWIDGAPLDPARGDLEAIRATGAELARLHRAAPRSGHAVSPPDLKPTVAAAVALVPERAGTVAALAAAIEASVNDRDVVPCVIHGDFSADQVIVRNGQATIIDWDRSTVGNPARDLGSFLARLDLDVIEGHVSGGMATTVADALLQGYADAAGSIPGDTTAHRAGALLALATEGFRRRRPDWCDEAEAVLARVEALLAAAGSAPSTRGLSAALDVARMGPRLARALGAPADAPVKAELLRHKPGRRALVRYEVEGAPPILGKLRQKGPDHRTPALHRALRAAGLDGRPPNRVGVPAPLAAFDEPPLWLQDLVPGAPLTGLLGTSAGPDGAGRTGQALATLHGSGVGSDRTWSMADELGVIDHALRDAGTSRPDLQGEIAALGRTALAVLGTIAGTTTTGIHRDFYPDQVLIADRAVWLVDLDLHAEGDPLIDVGNFLAHLNELGLREHGDPAHFTAEMAAFVAGYEDRRGITDRSRLSTLHWASLIRHVGLSLRIAGRAHTTERLLAICAEGPSAAAFADRRRGARPAA